MKTNGIMFVFSKIALLFALAAAHFPAYSAKWERVTGGDEWVVYIDVESQIFENAKRSIWVLWNYSSPQTESSSGTYQSTKARWHFDCKIHAAGLKSIVAYSEPHGLGAFVWQRSVDQPALEEVIPDSVGETLWKRVCLPKR